MRPNRFRGGGAKKETHCELFVRGCRWFYYFLPFQTPSVHFTLQILMMESTSQQLLGRPENLPRTPV